MTAAAADETRQMKPQPASERPEDPRDPLDEPARMRTKRSTPGIRCPFCFKRGIEVWVLPGRACPYCGSFSPPETRAESRPGVPKTSDEDRDLAESSRDIGGVFNDNRGVDVDSRQQDLQVEEPMMMQNKSQYHNDPDRVGPDGLQVTGPDDSSGEFVSSRRPPIQEHDRGESLAGAQDPRGREDQSSFSIPLDPGYYDENFPGNVSGPQDAAMNTEWDEFEQRGASPLLPPLYRVPSPVEDAHPIATEAAPWRQDTQDVVHEARRDYEYEWVRKKERKKSAGMPYVAPENFQKPLPTRTGRGGPRGARDLWNPRASGSHAAADASVEESQPPPATKAVNSPHDRLDDGAASSHANSPAPQPGARRTENDPKIESEESRRDKTYRDELELRAAKKELDEIRIKQELEEEEKRIKQKLELDRLREEEEQHHAVHQSNRFRGLTTPEQPPQETYSVPAATRDEHSISPTKESPFFAASKRELDAAEEHLRRVILPMLREAIANPPADREGKRSEHRRISELVLTQVMLKLDSVETAGSPELRARRKGLVAETQIALNELDKALVTDDRNRGESRKRR
jgi:hypothetical protein